MHAAQVSRAEAHACSPGEQGGGHVHAAQVSRGGGTCMQG